MQSPLLTLSLCFGSSSSAFPVSVVLRFTSLVARSGVLLKLGTAILRQSRALLSGIFIEEVCKKSSVAFNFSRPLVIENKIQ